MLASPFHGLPRTHRLLSAAAFAAVFKQGVKIRDAFFIVVAMPNGMPHGRIGLAVSRKVSPKAVARNIIKRQARASFRQHQGSLVGLDIVVVAQAHLGAKLGDAHIRRQIQNSLKEHWEKATKKCKKS